MSAKTKTKRTVEYVVIWSWEFGSELQNCITLEEARKLRRFKRVEGYDVDPIIRREKTVNERIVK